MKAFVDLRLLVFRRAPIVLFPVTNAARNGGRPEVLGPFTTSVGGVTALAATALIAMGAPALRSFTVSDEAKVSA